MELRQLEYLVAVAEEASFTRAAQRLHISQSGVSAQVRQLEQELGADLLDRSGRAVSLTQAGEAALVHARAALGAAAAMRQAVDDVSGLLRGRLTVGMVTACTITALFDALDRFHQAHPRVVLTLVEGVAADLAGQVRAGALDLALIAAAGALPEGLDGLPIVTERLVACVPPAHPLAGRASVALADLSGLALISMPPGAGVRAAFDQSCLLRDIALVIALEASAGATIADLALRDLGVAIVSETMAAAYGESLRALPIEDAQTPAVLALTWRQSPAPAVAELIRYCRKAFAARNDELITRDVTEISMGEDVGTVTRLEECPCQKPPLTP
ncbi:MAG TPA: LysR family transcriptional regulator [Trebonia sp.]|nr:LysR family transcriptional regulator [Trebonia sp.]